ncbi:DUF1957 domain-containing protein [Alicyclobacillaceae bacterium I2511]|nr:DUF1957 domain-containing protein [Alicyclobacillaceae bacterium I2511]
MNASGYVALVLHAHLPFVRHPESDKYLEERWLFEAITETYIPLLQTYENLIADGVDFRITMSLTPTLLAMLSDPFTQTRYLQHITTLIQLAEQEQERTANLPDFAPLAEFYHRQFKAIQSYFLGCDANLVGAFRRIQEAGKLEILTCAATHAFLPLVSTEQSIRAQIETAVHEHTRQLGRPPVGIWLPECGFQPGLDRILRDYGLQYFFTDTHGLTTAAPRPVFGTLSPVLTPHGMAAFARDEASSRQVWSSKEGYPGDFDYREYYRDIGYDLPFEDIRAFMHPAGIRHNTGLKYHRITGPTADKALYNPEWARHKAAEHAADFLSRRREQIRQGLQGMDRQPIVVAPYDAELFGHWWYEGPQWIDFLFRKMHFDQNEVKAITPSEYLRIYKNYQVCDLTLSSWGRDGYSQVWLNGDNDWIYPALHACEQRMSDRANEFQKPTAVQTRLLNQAARELMLAQSSDFAFIMDAKTMVDYAVKRTKFHVNRFLRADEMLRTGEIDEEWLSAVESLDNLFPYVDYHVYQTIVNSAQKSAADTSSDTSTDTPCVLILSWEFPPMTVGGLSRHVYDLSRYLAAAGWKVHVLTTRIGEYPHDEMVEGVHVHRVDVMKPDGGEFVHWAFQLNLAMLDACRELLQHIHVDLVHAHDWIVGYTAKAVKELYGLPLVATIHATEYGRNQGIHTDMQRYIHQLEWQLTYDAQRVILCSSYMQREVETVFNLPAEKLEVIPNGVDPRLIQVATDVAINRDRFALPEEQIVLFIGRLVREKGVQVLVEAAPQVLEACPRAKFVILGTGPAMQDLKTAAQTAELGARMEFRGFVTDEERNALLQIADLAVFPSLYEPFGIVALEAMAAHTPVVVSDTGGLGDVVDHGRNGYKAYAGNAISLATQIVAALCNPNEAQKMADAAREDLEKYDWRHIASQTIKVYKQTLKR